MAGTQRKEGLTASTALGLLVALGLWGWSFSILFADNRWLWGGNPAITQSSTYSLVIAATHLLPSGAVGYLTRRWWVSLLGAGMGVFLGLLCVLFGFCLSSTLPFNGLVVIPASVAVGGAMGVGIQKAHCRRRKKPQDHVSV